MTALSAQYNCLRHALEPGAHYAEQIDTNVSCLSELSSLRRPRYELLAHIGEGPSGDVFRARNLYSRVVVAVKIVKVNDREWVSREGDALFQIKKEVRLVNASSQYGSFGLLEVTEVIPFLDTLWMVSPLCRGGNLRTVMKIRARGYLEEKYITTVLRDVARALFWIHSQGTFHGNVKASNILLTESGSIRLCDFDLVARGELSASHSQSALDGSLHWLAPECLMDRHGFHDGMDTWAIGALAYELATGEPPNDLLESDTEILQHFARSGPPVLVGEQYSAGLKDLVTDCCVLDPSQRPNMNLVFSHPYLSSAPEYASLRALVLVYKEWEYQEFLKQNPGINAPPDQPPINESGTEAGSLPTGTPPNAGPEVQTSPVQGDMPATGEHDTQLPEFLNEALSELDGWAMIDEPSRCSSPFDLEHLILPTRTVSFEDIGAGGQDHYPNNSRVDTVSEASADDTNETGEVPIKIVMTVPQATTNTPSDPPNMTPGADDAGFNLDFNMVFNPGFDVFASDPAASSSSSDILSATTQQTTQPPSENLSNSGKIPKMHVYPRTVLWDPSPPLSPSSSPTRSVTGRPLAFVTGPGAIMSMDLPAARYYQRRAPQSGVAETDDKGKGNDDDDDDSSTLRPRDSNPVNLEQAAAVAPSTPPATPDQIPQSKGKEPASSPHAWPPFRLPNRSINDVRSHTFSPPPTPAIIKPLPPLPKAKPRSANQNRPSTSGGSSSRAALHSAVPPLPPIPIPVRRPSVDIFSPVSYDSFGSSFDTNGNIIPHPAPLSPAQPFHAPAAAATNALTPRQKEKSPAVARERMIPREAGSCPPRRRKSHPTTGSSRAKGSSSSHVPSTSSSSSSSSSSTHPPTTKPPPRNASFSVFPTSQSASLAAAAQAAMNARSQATNSSVSHSAMLPPRRPSAPILTNPQSFFDDDGDGDIDSEDYDSARSGGAADFKKGVRRIVNSVSANLGDTIRGLETAPRKGFRWMKRSSP